MNKEQVDLLGDCLKIRNIPILLKEIPENIIRKGAVVLDSSCSNSELIGYYDNFEYKVPEWINKLNESSKLHNPVLIIRDINKISKKEQRKFIELLKYKKIYINKIPENCIILFTYFSNLEDKPIEEELYSFMLHI